MLGRCGRKGMPPTVRLLPPLQKQCLTGTLCKRPVTCARRRVGCYTVCRRQLRPLRQAPHQAGRPGTEEAPGEEEAIHRRAARYAWALLLARIHEVFPLPVLTAMYRLHTLLRLRWISIRFQTKGVRRLCPCSQQSKPTRCRITCNGKVIGS